MNIHTFIFLISCSFIGVSCGKLKPQEALSQKWKLDGVAIPPKNNVDSLPFKPVEISKAKISYHFNPNKTYTIQRGTQVEGSGNWGISSNEKVLVLHSNQKSTENEEFRIKELTYNRLVLISEHRGSLEALYFSPLIVE